jgi:PAS domain S-box-containing protein
MVRTILGGAVLILFLVILDYLVAGPAPQFTLLRLGVIVMLAANALLIWKYDRAPRWFYHCMAWMAVLGTAAVIEAMITNRGVDASPYVAAHMLVGICAIGFIPAPTFVHAVTALLVQFFYAMTVLLLFPPVGENYRAFIAGNLQMTAIFSLIMFLRWQNTRSQAAELGLRFDLEESELRHRDLFENASDAIFVLDLNHRFVDVNRRATEIFGWSRAEFLSMSAFDLIPPEQCDISGGEFIERSSSGHSETFEQQMRTKDGRCLDVEIGSSSIVKSGRVTGFQDIVRDVTDQHRVQQQFQRSQEDLEQKVEERTAALIDTNLSLSREVSERSRAEEQLKEQLERQGALRTIQTAITSSLDLSLTLNVFIEQVRVHLKADAATILLYNPKNLTLGFGAGRGFSSNRIRRVTVKAGESLAGSVIMRREKMIIPDMRAKNLHLPTGFGYDFQNSFLVMEEGFQSYVGLPLLAKGQIIGVLEIFNRAPLAIDEAWSEFLEALAQMAAIAIDNSTMFEELQQSRDEVVMAYDKTIEGWSRALDIRDNETHGHSRRVTEITEMVARRMGVPEDELTHIRRGALLHDIGKLGVPDRILLKPGKLTQEELVIMRRHPETAYDILSPIPFLRDAIAIPYSHHERWDGTGYPKGLAREEIPLPARIFAVVDVWDALRFDRPYRQAWEEGRVIEHLVTQKGSHFDPAVVDAFLDVLRNQVAIHSG